MCSPHCSFLDNAINVFLDVSVQCCKTLESLNFQTIINKLSTKYNFQDLGRHWPVQTLNPFAKLKGSC